MKRANPLTGQADYPEPEKGYLDQDADLMLAFAVCDDWREERAEEKKRREEQRAYTADFFRGRQ